MIRRYPAWSGLAVVRRRPRQDGANQWRGHLAVSHTRQPCGLGVEVRPAWDVEGRGLCARLSSLLAPFIEATPAPAEPPTVELLGAVDGKPMLGVLYTADWPVRAAQVRKRPRLPVPWPAAANLGSPGSVTLRFHARTPPDRVVMKTFSQLDPATGEPASDPAASYRCSRSSDPRCSFERSRSAVRLRGLPPSVLARGFLVVFCTWSVPPEQQAERGGAEAAASWLFRIG